LDIDAYSRRPRDDILQTRRIKWQEQRLRAP